MTDAPAPPAASDATRTQLLVAAIDRFGRDGYEGASTRAIAAAVGKPMSAITYHFGGKHGLYLAAAGHIASELGALFAPALAMSVATDDPAGARAGLDALLLAGVEMVTIPETEAFARFIIREQTDPTDAFEILYEGFMKVLFDRATALMGRAAAHRLDESELRLRATMLVGQLLMFRVSRAAVLRHMGWADIGPVEREHITETARSHLDAILTVPGRGG